MAMAVIQSVFSIESMIRGYHVYQDVWQAVLDEELTCRREPFNPNDPFAVSVLRDNHTVGHLPGKISSICSLFIRRGGTLTVKISGVRRHSSDLPQGGLEIPCTLLFKGKVSDTEKVKKLLLMTRQDSSANTSEDQYLPSQKKKEVEASSHVEEQSTLLWVKMRGYKTDRTCILYGEKLDNHVNFAQLLLKAQFPSLNGLKSTLLQCKKQPFSNVTNVLQIIHTRNNHWIAISTVQSRSDCITVSVYDSLFQSLDAETEDIICKLFKADHIPLTLQMMPCQQQTGGDDCGLFAIATITTLAFNHNPSTVTYAQTEMRKHVVECFEKHHISPFPAPHPL